MARLVLEYSDSLYYKELTHFDGTRGWRPATTPYRWEKRRMSKVSRRNGKEIVAEYSDSGPDLELAALLELWVAYLLFLDKLYFIQAFSMLMQPDCDGPGYCSICDRKG